MRGERLLAAGCALVLLAGCALPWNRQPSRQGPAKHRPTPAAVGAQFTLDGHPASGAVNVTANSSGDFLVRPAALRNESQPLNTLAHRHKTKAACRNFISDLA